MITSLIGDHGLEGVAMKAVSAADTRTRRRTLWIVGAAVLVVVALLVRFVIFPTNSHGGTTSADPSGQTPSITQASARAAQASSVAEKDLPQATSALSSIDSLLSTLSSPHPSANASDAGSLSSAAAKAAILASQAADQLTQYPVSAIASEQQHLTPAEQQQEQGAVTAALPELRQFVSLLSSTDPPTLQRAVSSRLPPGNATLDAYPLTATSTPPAPIATIGAVAPRLRHPMIQLLKEMEAIASEGLLLAAATAPQAVSDVVTLINLIVPLLHKVAGAVATLLLWETSLPSTIIQNATKVGPGWPSGYCPSGINPITCWLLQGDNGEFVSKLLSLVAADSGVASLICLVGSAFSEGTLAPLAAIADVEAISTGIIQLAVDAIRLSGYSDSNKQESSGVKTETVFVDAVGILLSVIALGSFGAGARVLTGVAGEAATDEKVVEAGSALFNAVEDTAPNIELVKAVGGVVSLIENFRSTQKAIKSHQAATIARTIATKVRQVSDAYRGPANVQVHQAANLIARLLDTLFPGENTTTPSKVPAGQSGSVPVTACSNVSSLGVQATAVPTQAQLPGGVILPAGAEVYGIGVSETPSLPVDYAIGPPGMICSAGIGADGGNDIWIASSVLSPSASIPVQYDFNPGGAAEESSTDCTYFDVPSINAPGEPCGAGNPATGGEGNSVTTIRTGNSQVLAEVVAVAPGGTGAGTGRQYAFPVYLAAVGASNGYFAQFAVCALPATQRATCRAALDLFVAESDVAVKSAGMPDAPAAVAPFEAAIGQVLGGS